MIVVINKCDHGVPRLLLEETKLRRDCPAIVDFIYISCDPGELAAASIVSLRELIAATLNKGVRLELL